MLSSTFFHGWLITAHIPPQRALPTENDGSARGSCYFARTAGNLTASCNRWKTGYLPFSLAARRRLDGHSAEPKVRRRQPSCEGSARTVPDDWIAGIKYAIRDHVCPIFAAHVRPSWMAEPGTAPVPHLRPLRAPRREEFDGKVASCTTLGRGVPDDGRPLPGGGAILFLSRLAAFACRLSPPPPSAGRPGHGGRCRLAGSRDG